jgi:hypothetical protein
MIHKCKQISYKVAMESATFNEGIVVSKRVYLKKYLKIRHDVSCCL